MPINYYSSTFKYINHYICFGIHTAMLLGYHAMLTGCHRQYGEARAAFIFGTVQGEEVTWEKWLHYGGRE
jgi:hypothetical protein